MNDPESVAERRFTMADQTAFGALSGDVNPLHLDPVMARRGLFGEVVVHGIHLVLWAMDCLSKKSSGPLFLERVKASFHRPAFLGDPVQCRYDGARDGTEYLRLYSRGQLLTQIAANTGSKKQQRPWTPAPKPTPDKPRSLSFSEAANDDGHMEIYFDGELFASLFPALAGRAEPFQTATLLATSRMVGMRCPGLRSLLADLDMSFPDTPSEPLGNRMTYRVETADERLNLLRIRIEASGIQGLVGTFFPPVPAEGISASALAGLLADELFAGRRCLVVGGSRGLGEISSKMIAMAGGGVRLTYRIGRDDAERVAEDIGAAGGEAKVLPFDVGNPPDAATLRSRLGHDWIPTDLLYFAAPRILPTPRSGPDERLHRTFMKFFVEGFDQTVGLLRDIGAQRLRAFYPSTEFLDREGREFLEYRAAKSAGEEKCAEIERRYPQVRIFAPRLPRLRTDQTQAIGDISADDPVAVMRGALERFAGIR